MEKIIIKAYHEQNKEEKDNIISDFLFKKIKNGYIYKDKLLKLSPDVISESKYIRFNTVLNNSDYSWVYSRLMVNNNIPEYFIRDNIRNVIDCFDNHCYYNNKYCNNYCKKLSISKNIPIELFNKAVKYLGNYNYFDNPNMTLEFIEKELNKMRKFSRDESNSLTNHEKITTEFLEKNIKKEWISYFYKHDNLTLDIIEKYIDDITDFITLGCNKNLTLNFIEKYDFKDWSNFTLSSNSSIININNIDSIPQKYFNYLGFLQNETITLEYLQQNISKQGPFFMEYNNNNMKYIYDCYTYVTLKFSFKEIYENRQLIWNYPLFSNNRFDKHRRLDDEYLVKFTDAGLIDYRYGYDILIDPNISINIIKKIASTEVDFVTRDMIYKTRRFISYDNKINNILSWNKEITEDTLDMLYHDFSNQYNNIMYKLIIQHLSVSKYYLPIFIRKEILKFLY